MRSRRRIAGEIAGEGKRFYFNSLGISRQKLASLIPSGCAWRFPETGGLLTTPRRGAGNRAKTRRPQAVVEALSLKEGDQVEITVAGERALEIDSRRRHREKALQRLRSRGWRFNREQLHER